MFASGSKFVDSHVKPLTKAAIHKALTTVKGELNKVISTGKQILTEAKKVVEKGAGLLRSAKESIVNFFTGGWQHPEIRRR